MRKKRPALQDTILNNLQLALTAFCIAALILSGTLLADEASFTWWDA